MRSGASVRLRRLRQRFGIGAPRLAIRTHIAWYWRALAVIVVLTVSLLLAAWVFDAGRRIAGYDSDESAREIQNLSRHVMELDAELTKLRSLAGSGESNLQIERATLQQLSRQVRALEQENQSLKEDLAFFEGLMPAASAANEPGVRIDRLKILPGISPGEYRYRMLVLNNGGKQAKELKGAVQFVVKALQDGKESTIILPPAGDEDGQRFRFEVKYFLRLEGVFSVAPGLEVRSVEVRLLQDGVIRTKQTVSF